MNERDICSFIIQAFKMFVGFNVSLENNFNIL